ncbi:hypothetical protein H0E87_007252, partial [Populus deltoides]
ALEELRAKAQQKGSLGGSGLKKSVYSALMSTVDEEDDITIPHDFILFAEFLRTLMRKPGILAIVM